MRLYYFGVCLSVSAPCEGVFETSASTMKGEREREKDNKRNIMNTIRIYIYMHVHIH